MIRTRCHYLQHITRQKARMFSVAHDLLSADIATSTFDPLSIFVDCDSTRYVVVSAQVRLPAEQRIGIVGGGWQYVNRTVSVTTSIHISVTERRASVPSVAYRGHDIYRWRVDIRAAGRHLNNLASWWKLDEVNDAIYSEKNVYSQQGVSAYGIGSGGSGGGGDISKLPSWAGYTPAMVDYYVSAGLLVPFYNDMQARVGGD